MKNWWEKIKEHPIYSNVVAQLIGGAIIGIIGIIYFKAILNFARQTWIVPMWGLVLMGIIPAIIMLIIYIFYHHKKLIFIEEEGIYKDKKSESRFCIICKSQLQKIDHFWYCNKCNRSFGKRTFAQSSNRKVISPGIGKEWFGKSDRW